MLGIELCIFPACIVVTVLITVSCLSIQYCRIHYAFSDCFVKYHPDTFQPCHVSPYTFSSILDWIVFDDVWYSKTLLYRSCVVSFESFDV